MMNKRFANMTVIVSIVSLAAGACAPDLTDMGENGNAPVAESAMIVTGDEHACMLLPTGTVRCWGQNEFGQLGMGHTRPVEYGQMKTQDSDVALDGAAVDIVAGRFHTCALLEDGAVQCWGGNEYGQLGHQHRDAIGDDESVAAAGTVRLSEPAVEISAGLLHTCVVLDSGAERCWGADDSGAEFGGTTAGKRSKEDDQPVGD